MTTHAELDQRYGRTTTPARRRRRWIVGIVVAALVAGGILWLAVAPSFESVRADGVGMQLVDERTVVVDFQISGPPDREIACALEALDEEFGVVGWRVVIYPPSPDRHRAFRESIPTVAPATTGLVNSCWVT